MREVGAMMGEEEREVGVRGEEMETRWWRWFIQFCNN